MEYAHVTHISVTSAKTWGKQGEISIETHICIIYFKEFSLTQVNHLGQKYDYGSIMHYGSRAFAKDRSKPTISTKQNGVTFGQRSRRY